MHENQPRVRIRGNAQYIFILLAPTDIIDNIRTIRLVTTDDNQLDPTPEFLENFEMNLNRMIATLATQQVEQSGVDE